MGVLNASRSRARGLSYATMSRDTNAAFSKAQLFHALGKKLDVLKHEISANTTVTIQEEEEATVSFDILERHIEKLTQEYQANILKAVRAFYEK